MKNKYKLWGIILLVVLAAGGAYAVNKTQNPEYEVTEEHFAADPDVIGEVARDYVLLDVPFTAQAPTANWDDPRQQDGCEEASLLMAWAWVNKWPSINPQDAEKTIIEMSEFEKSEYGNYLDLNAADTAQLMKDFFKYDKTEVQYDITIDDIKKELIEGNLVIVPANGKRLENASNVVDHPTERLDVLRQVSLILQV